MGIGSPRLLATVARRAAATVVVALTFVPSALADNAGLGVPVDVNAVLAQANAGAPPIPAPPVDAASVTATTHSVSTGSGSIPTIPTSQRGAGVSDAVTPVIADLTRASSNARSVARSSQHASTPADRYPPRHRSTPATLQHPRRSERMRAAVP